MMFCVEHDKGNMLQPSHCKKKANLTRAATRQGLCSLGRVIAGSGRIDATGALPSAAPRLPCSSSTADPEDDCAAERLRRAASSQRLRQACAPRLCWPFCRQRALSEPEQRSRAAMSSRDTDKGGSVQRLPCLAGPARRVAKLGAPAAKRGTKAQSRACQDPVVSMRR